MPFHWKPPENRLQRRKSMTKRRSTTAKSSNLTRAPSWHTGGREESSGGDSGGPSKAVSGIFKSMTFHNPIRGRLVKMFCCWFRRYHELYMCLGLYRVSLCRNQLSVNFLWVCVHLTLPGRVFLLPFLQLSGLILCCGPGDPIPHRIQCPGPTSIPSTASPRFSHFHLLSCFVSKLIGDKVLKIKLHPNISASVRYFFSLTNSLKRDISLGSAERALCSILTLSCSGKAPMSFSYKSYVTEFLWTPRN